jgi:CBS domain-containing protein
MDVMVRDVITIGREDSIAEAAKLIAQNNVSELPVVDEEGQLVRIISESDLMRDRRDCFPRRYCEGTG